jgi:hypothetical protein
MNYVMNYLMLKMQLNDLNNKKKMFLFNNYLRIDFFFLSDIE